MLRTATLRFGILLLSFVLSQAKVCPATGQEFSPDRIVVQLQSDRFAVSKGPSGEDIVVTLASPRLEASLAAAGVASLKPLFPEFKSADRYSTNPLGEPIVLPDLSAYFVAPLNFGISPEVASLSLRGDPDVVSAERIPISRAMLTPNDPLFPLQWGLRNDGTLVCGSLPTVAGTDVGATAAWDQTLGSSSVRIGIIDTGVLNSHADLAGRVVLGPNFSTDPGTSVDNNGHGTRISGVIGANIGNGIGVAGLAAGVTMVAIKALNHDGEGESTNLAQAMEWARQQAGPNRIPILNLSYGTCAPPFAAEADACRAAVQSGMILCAAMGNSSIEEANYPAAFDRTVVGVGALFANGRRWSNSELGVPGQFHTCQGAVLPAGSTLGPWIDLAAPGGLAIATTNIDGGYLNLSPCGNAFNGTSAAAPVVAGAAGLLMSKYPALNLLGEEVAEILRRTARDVAFHGPGFDVATGHGLVRVPEAISFLGPGRTLSRALATTMNLHSITNVDLFISDTQGFPTSGYPNSKRHVLRKAVSFPVTYSILPSVWARISGTNGGAYGNPYVGVLTAPFGRIVEGSVTMSGCEVETSVYEVRNVSNSFVGWLPCSPAQATVAITAVGGDNVPPGVVSNLTGAPVANSKIILHWTAPGDDGSVGTATEYDLRYSTAAFGDKEFPFAFRVSGMAPPQAAGSAEAWTVQGLTACVTYYFALKTRDAAGNWSGISNMLVQASGCDLTPPAAVTNLAIQGMGRWDGGVKWNAPGDDGSSGQAALFDLRYALAPITAGNFAQATPVSSGVPVPGPVGTPHCAVITLSPCSQYYFAIKTRDEENNWSPISNVVSGTTLCSGNQFAFCDEGAGVAGDEVSGRGPEGLNESGQLLGPEVALGLGVPRPNPTATSARIALSVDAARQVRLAVYSLGGRRVRTLVDRKMEPGVHDVIWDGRDDGGLAVAPGVYFYRMTTEDWRAERKLLFVGR